MINSLKGTVSLLRDDWAVVEIGGVGLQVYLPAPTRLSWSVGEPVFVHTYLVVRQDALSLYGFETSDARDFFVLLLGVNGVGPRLALSILSALEPDTIRRAVFQEQVEIFSRVPGVGKKTAQKIQLHLQDKLPEGRELERIGYLSDADGEVLAALTSLGYSVVEAQAALQSIPRDAPEDIESRLRLALQYFSR
ncbi:MAG TPA: Holliday junction branch migration protein RuvA [Anaerolineales bacterium]|nr:Holliday junction branch migration protein RuvA [Anaerolineales bacterium]